MSRTHLLGDSEHRFDVLLNHGEVESANGGTKTVGDGVGNDFGNTHARRETSCTIVGSERFCKSDRVSEEARAKAVDQLTGTKNTNASTLGSNRHSTQHSSSTDWRDDGSQLSPTSLNSLLLRLKEQSPLTEHGVDGVVNRNKHRTGFFLYFFQCGFSSFDGRFTQGEMSSVAANGGELWWRSVVGRDNVGGDGTGTCSKGESSSVITCGTRISIGERRREQREIDEPDE